VAEAIEPICADQPNPEEIELSFVIGLIMERLEVKRQRATTLVTLLSQKEKSATRIYVDGSYIEYWISKRTGKDGKPQKTSPWVIHSKELS